MDGRIYYLTKLILGDLSRKWTNAEMSWAVNLSIPHFQGRFKAQAMSVVLGLVLCSALATISVAQESVIRVKTDLVIVPVTVSDQRGKYIDTLDKGDFRISENGIEQEIAFFEPSRQPVTVIFVVDVSSSMYRYTNDLNLATLELARRLRANDQLLVSSFFQTSEPVLGPVEVQGISKWKAFRTQWLADCPDTYIYNGVDDALGRLTKLPPGRKVLMLFTDGEGEGFGVSAQDNFRRAEKLGVMVYTFKFGRYDAATRKESSAWIERVYKYLNDLAARTGGRSFQIEEITNIAETFGQVAREIGNTYRLGYYPASEAEAGVKRSIDVKVQRSDAIANFKASYVPK